MGRHVACMGEMRKACSILVRKPKGKRPLGEHQNGSWEHRVGRYRLHACGSGYGPVVVS
jgi:hypothetical protein